MRTRKVLALLFILVSLGLVGCYATTYQVLLSPQGSSELKVSISAKPDDPRSFVFTIEGDKILSVKPGDLKWYYDVPEDKPEYGIIEYHDNDLFWLYLHQRISKKPK